MVSVIVPVYNVSRYVERCVKSILLQTYSYFELILINDGSTDESGEICERLAEEDKRIKVIHKKNGGLSDARNTGIEYARGEYYLFVDSDDFLHKDMLKILYENAVAYDADISVCGFQWLAEDEAVNLEIGENKPRCYEGAEVIKQLFDNNVETVVAWNKLYKVSLFERIQYPVGRLHEDEFIIHRLLYKCRRIVYSQCKLYYYIKRGNSITGQLSDKRIKDTLAAFEDRVYFFEEAGLIKESNQEYRHWLRILLERYKRCRTEGIEGYKKTRKWLRSHLKGHLKTLKEKKIINQSEWLEYFIWTRFPLGGYALSKIKDIKGIVRKWSGKVFRKIKDIKNFK